MPADIQSQSRVSVFCCTRSAEEWQRGYETGEASNRRQDKRPPVAK